MTTWFFPYIGAFMLASQFRSAVEATSRYRSGAPLWMRALWTLAWLSSPQVLQLFWGFGPWCSSYVVARFSFSDFLFDSRTHVVLWSDRPWNAYVRTQLLSWVYVFWLAVCLYAQHPKRRVGIAYATTALASSFLATNVYDGRVWVSNFIGSFTILYGLLAFYDGRIFTSDGKVFSKRDA